VQPEGGNTFKVDADYKGGDFSAGAYFFAGGLVGASYLQSLSEGLSLGVEGFYHLLNQKGGGAGALRYAWGHKGSSVLTAKAGTFGNGMLELAYQRKVTEKVALATELQYYHGQICQFGLGYEFKLRSAVFKGLISSDTTCSAVLEERISQGGGIGLTLSGMLNHKKKDYKFGIGLSLEGMGVGP
jgi:mitochondrial import receptor subunit TOM40